MVHTVTKLRSRETQTEWSTDNLSKEGWYYLVKSPGGWQKGRHAILDGDRHYPFEIVVNYF